MKNLLRLIIFVLLIGGWTVFAAAVHVVRTPERVVVVPKDRLSFGDTYVDTRSWTLGDAASHPDLLKRIIETGKSDSLAHLSDLKAGQDVQSQLSDALHSGAATTKPTTQTTMTRTPVLLRPVTQPTQRVNHSKPLH